MSMYDKNHYNIVISLQLIKINEKTKENIELGINTTIAFTFTMFQELQTVRYDWGIQTWETLMFQEGRIQNF